MLVFDHAEKQLNFLFVFEGAPWKQCLVFQLVLAGRINFFFHFSMFLHVKRLDLKEKVKQ